MLTGPDKGDFQFLALPNVVAPETEMAALKNLSLRGWQIADRWALGAPATVKAMEKAGTLIPCLKEQQMLEAATISDARVGGRMQDLPDSEILALHNIPLLPANNGDAEQAFTFYFPADTSRKFSPEALKHIETLSKNDPVMKFSFVPGPKGEAVFDPELSDAVYGRFPWKNASVAEKQEAINEAWADGQD